MTQTSRDDALAAALQERDDALEMLDAWFDRRPLLRESIDQAVKDLVAGWLRTCRCGGMTRKQSDVVQSIVDDMCDKNVFADLLGRLLGDPVLRSQQQPAGWRLAPTDPTDEMLHAFWSATDEGRSALALAADGRIPGVQALWAAMLAASPSPPLPTDQHQEPMR